MATLQQLRLALQQFQSNRLRRDYSDLAAIPQYEPAGEFFFNEMYGPHDFSDRDAGARRVQHFLHLVPAVRLHDIEEVLELLDSTVALDDYMARLMFAQGIGDSFDEQTYDRIYREADNYDARIRQLGLVRNTLLRVFQLSRSPLLGVALRRAGLVARLAGIAALHGFLTKGFDALCEVQNIDHFAITIYNRELERLNRIYER